MKKHVSWLPALVALIVAALLTWLITSVVVTRGMAEFQTHIEQRAQLLAEDHRKANLLGAIAAIAGTDEQVRATAQGKLPRDNPQVMGKLAYLFDTLGLGNIFVMSADGVMNAYMARNVTTTLTGKNYAWRPYFSGAIAGKPTMYAALGSNTRERGFYVSTPIPGSTSADGVGAPVGVVVAKLGFEEIDQVLATQKQPMAVLSPEGVVFASNIPAWVYQVLGGPDQLKAAKTDRRVNNAYKEHAPSLIALADGHIQKDGQSLRMFATPIGWPDPSGAWQLAGFINPQDVFGWPARVATMAALFVLLLFFNAWWRARQRVRARTSQVIGLLDNSGEGFLSFGRDLRVDRDYSRACEMMLGATPSGKDIGSLLFADDPDAARLMRDTMEAALDADDADIRACMVSLLPGEIARNGRRLAVRYRYISREKFMIVLSDVTEQRHVAELLEIEQRHLKFVVLAVSDSANFFEAIDSFRLFLAAPPAAQRASTKAVYREVHTFKGLFNQFSFPRTPKVLHEIETRLAHVIEGAPADTAGGLSEDEMAQLREAFSADLNVLGEALGKDFLEQGRSLVLSQAQAQQLEGLARSLLKGEAVNTALHDVRQLLGDILRLRKVRLADALRMHERLVVQVAQRLEKKVAPLVVEGGDDIWVNPQAYRPFLQSLGHVFRNAVTHGIEAPEIRWENDKDETGHIRCRIRTEAGKIHLDIADDGGGLDLAALRARAVADGSAGTQDMDDAAVADLIFADSVSTQAEVTDLAGRGMGLAAVKAETERLGGSVTVRTRAGAGMELRFTLPLSVQGDDKS